ncbi:putative glycolipid-binding domain-containing protein [Williamsia sterculiae]|uniref:Glycolipid-binding n=1 Tax=Williamsia sterculiae TaxID=1344003 RepID=A0A1N7FDS2_9NOCA|nr:putative glycolipid-binding domain-containing protein [Williamsia sterculiae]SIR98376.1 hypothetical protein SAMN05445060_1961 [Williamsia sterculiae]
MNSPDVANGLGAVDDTADPAASDDFKKVITWRGVDADRLEQVRLVVTGQRIKATGQIIAAATDERPAFSVSYSLVTNDAGITRRLAVTMTKESGDTQISITRDAENVWLVQTPEGVQRSEFGGAEDVDLALSPMFNALPIRRHSLHRVPAQLTVPVVYLYLPSGEVTEATLQYTSGADDIAIISPIASTTVTVDEAGFVVDYPGLAARV